MMGWIENEPQKSGGIFLSINSFLPKLKRYLLDLSVLNTTSFGCHAFLLDNFWYLLTTIFEDNYRPHPKVCLHTSSVMRV
jgi:hypothetical protein